MALISNETAIPETTAPVVAAIVTEPAEIERMIQERQDRGIDLHDEVWEEVYFMSPGPNNEHQHLATRLSHILNILIDSEISGTVLAGTNITDRPDDWTKNYRVPDVVYFSQDTRAIDKDTHWLGGPDLAVEIVSPRDRSREKFSFYEKVKTRELLIVDRDPWQLELHRLLDSKLVVVGTSTLADSAWITSETVPLKMRLQPGETRPTIELAHTTSEKTWVV